MKNIEVLVSSITKLDDRYVTVLPLSDTSFSQLPLGTLGDFSDRSGNFISGRVTKRAEVITIDTQTNMELVIEKVRTSIIAPRNVSSTPR